MNVIGSSALALVLCVPLSSLAHGGAPSPRETAAAHICKTGTDQLYGHPSNACWIALDGALARFAYTHALEYGRIGCAKYRRADYCGFIASAKSVRGSLVLLSSRRASTAAQDVARGLNMVDPVDLEDGEIGILIRELRVKQKQR